jgi:guanyl-specific ribonuclease Sa
MMIVLIAATMIVAWLLVRAAGSDPAGTSPDARSSPGHSVTSPMGAEPAQRHTASGGSGETSFDGTTDPVSGLPWIAESALPPEAHQTLALIERGGPFPYPRNDDQTFQNREGLLPSHRRGYYREFTVETPGSDDRGARRIVTGEGGEKYWTDDHYDSFLRIKEGS